MLPSSMVYLLVTYLATRFCTFSDSSFGPSYKDIRPSIHTLKTGRTISIYCKLLLLCLGSRKQSSPRKPNGSVGLSVCVFRFKSFVIVTPRYLMLSTFSRSRPYNVYEAWVLLVSFFVTCIMLHLTGWNRIPHFLAQLHKRSIDILLKVKCMQRSGTEPIRTQLKP